VQEPAGGVVEQLFSTLAIKRTKNGSPIFVFWDAKCLNDGRNWEEGFIHGLQQSQAIILLISHTVYFFFTPFFVYIFLFQAMQGIISNAPNQQDNVLVEYLIFFIISLLSF